MHFCLYSSYVFSSKHFRKKLLVYNKHIQTPAPEITDKLGDMQCSKAGIVGADR